MGVVTRRERPVRIIEWMSPDRRRREFERLMFRRGLSTLIDEAIGEFAASLVRAYRREQAMNRRNREIFAARAKAPAP